MNIVNKTQSSLNYGTQSSGAGDCGTILPGESTYLPYTEKCGVFSVAISPVVQGKSGENYFEFNNVKPGAVITIATCVEL
jgi:hypothetical protein